MSFETLDLVMGWASLVLTLFIFSYLLADNFLYRIAVHILVGVTAAYVAIVAVESVILPWLDTTLLTDADDADIGIRIVGVIPLLIGLLLWLKNAGILRSLGNWGAAFVIGVGTGVAIVGAVVGSIIPLSDDAGASFDEYTAGNAILLVLGTVTTLIYFQYLGKRQTDGHVSRTLPMRLLAGIGNLFIAITLGALYAGIIITSLTAVSGVLADQLTFLLE